MKDSKIDILKQFLQDGITYVEDQDDAEYLEAVMKLSDQEVYILPIRENFIRVELVVDEEED